MSELLNQSEGRASAAIIDVEPKLVFQQGGDERYELASVAKIYILAAYLDKIAQEGREPGPEEFEMMRAMIEYSDNDSATSMFYVLGGADGINAFLTANFLSPIEPAFDGSWGSMRASPIQVGELLTSLYLGRVLDVPQTSLSFSLLANVIDEQAWGVGSASDGRGVDGVYLKNGWLSEEEGWIVNSVGLLTATDRTYVLVFMSDRQPTFEKGVEDIEKAVALIRSQLFEPQPSQRPTTQPAGSATPTGTPEPAFTPTREPDAVPQPLLPRERERAPAIETPSIRTGRLMSPDPGPIGR